jgi:hypothetical protein
MHIAHTIFRPEDTFLQTAAPPVKVACPLVVVGGFGVYVVPPSVMRGAMIGVLAGAVVGAERPGWLAFPLAVDVVPKLRDGEFC